MEFGPKKFVLNYKNNLSNNENENKENIDNLQKEIEKNNKRCEIKSQKVIKQLDIIKKYKLQMETNVEVKSGYENMQKKCRK